MLMFILLFAGMGGMFAIGVWVDFVQTDARSAQACVTSWDARFEPRYAGGKCSIIQRGYRVPTSASDWSSPEAREW